MQGDIDVLTESAYTGIYQKAFDQGAFYACLCVVMAAFAGGGAWVLVLWRWL